MEKETLAIRKDHHDSGSKREHRLNDLSDHVFIVNRLYGALY